MLRLKEIRTSHNISQMKLSEIIGVSRSTVSMWESGSSQPDYETLIKIADYFDCSTDYLLGRVSHPTYEIRKAPPESGAKEYAVDANAPDLTVEEIQELRRLLQERNK